MPIHNLSLLMFLLISITFDSIYSSFIDRDFYECSQPNERCGCLIKPRKFFRTARILGGEQVTDYESWPWLVSLRRWGHHVCGGVIISSSFILTAAHCVPPTGLSIVIGIIQQSNLTIRDARVRAITKAYIHANFSSEYLYNDIAVLHLERRLSNQNLPTICLPSESDPLPIDDEVIAIGFGRERESSTRSSDNLRQVKLRLLSPTSETCKNEVTDPSTQFCAGLETSDKDTCKGDSGGPLMYFSPIRQRFELIGLISFGTGCGHANHAGVYTRITAHLDWINSVMQN